MKFLVTIVLLISTGSAWCQHEELYQLVFSDTSNFRLTTLLGHSRPAKILILDSTVNSNKRRFWLDELDKRSPELIEKMKKDEHHPYNTFYLFTNPELDSLISNKEKKYLAQQTGQLHPEKIVLKGNNYRTITSPGKIRGFYFTASRPLFSSDNRYVFIDLGVLYKETAKQDINESWFGSICIVYQRQADNSWKKIAVRNHLIL